MGMTINVTVKSNDPDRIQSIIDNVVQQVAGQSPQINMTNSRVNLVDTGAKSSYDKGITTFGSTNVK
jgi:hypothetical protein